MMVLFFNLYLLFGEMPNYFIKNVALFNYYNQQGPYNWAILDLSSLSSLRLSCNNWQMLNVKIYIFTINYMISMENTKVESFSNFNYSSNTFLSAVIYLALSSFKLIYRLFS